MVKSRRYPAEITMDAVYADDLVFHANTSAQVKSQLHSLEQAARGIVLDVNLDKTKFICFNQDGAIFTLNNKFLKLVDHFI